MPPGGAAREESRRGEKEEEPGPGGEVGQIHNPGRRSVVKVRAQKADWGGARAKEMGSGRSRVCEATWGRGSQEDGRGRSQGPGDKPGEGPSLQRPFVFRQGGAEPRLWRQSYQGAEPEPRILNA